MPRLPFAMALGCLLLAGSRASAVVEAEMPLAQLVMDSQLIAVARLEQVDRESGKGTLRIERFVQGDSPAASIPIKLIASEGSGGEGNPHDMLDRVQEGTTLVLFLSSLAPQEHQAFAYANGSWFKLRGVGELSQLKALFIQGEPYLRRTFHGDDAELVKLLDDFAAGRGTLPGLDKSAKPELGPTLHDAPPPKVVASASNQIEIGPAWRTEGNELGSQLPSTSLNYVVAAVLLLSALGLAFLLTRSSPGAAA